MNSIVARLNSMCSPSYINTPDNISKKALPVWKYIIVKYADEIFNSRLVDNQWKTSIYLFEKICKNKGILCYH
jgi:hypothetical protein